jgi:hypothetical protein
MSNIFYISLGTALPLRPLAALPLATAAMTLIGKWISIHWNGF